MGTGYTRNDTSNNIADGNIINAADLDGEFDAIESAFGTSGHTHDGTSAEGGPITVLGPVQDFVASATEIKPKTTNTLDIGTSSLLFKDLFLDGVAALGSIKIDNDGTIGSASDGDAITISSGGVVTFSQAPLVDVTNATTNAVTDVLGIQVQSTGTPAVGIGSGLTLGVETASGNVETAGAIRIVSTGLTPTDEEIDLVFYSMRNGSLTEGFRYDSSADSLDVTGILTVSGSSTSTFNSGAENVVATFTSTDTEAQINLVDSTGSAQIRSRNDLRFYTNGGSTRAMDIDSSGKVGINEDSPQTKLHIKNSSVGESWSAYSGTVATLEENSANGGVLQFVSNSSYTGEIWFGDADARNQGRIRYEHANDKLELWSNGVERIGIESTGKVIIQTPTSGTALEVNLIDNAADGFIVKQGSNEYISVDTTNSSEKVLLGNTTTNPKVGIGNTSPSATLDVKSTGAVMTTLRGTSSSIAYLDLTNYATSGNGVGSGIEFRANSSTQERQIGFITAEWTDNTDATRDSRMDFDININGGTTAALRLGVDEITVNEGGHDTNFRVEGSSQPYMIFVDAGNDRVGIANSTPDATLHVGTVNPQSDAKLVVRENGNCLEWGHGNTSFGYYGILGTNKNNGHAFIGFGAKANSGTSNTHDTTGHQGTVLRQNISGVFIVEQSTNANADDQSFNERVRMGSSEVVFNEESTDTDFRIEGNNDTHIFYVDAGQDEISMGTSANTAYDAKVSITVDDSTNHTDFQTSLLLNDDTTSTSGSGGSILFAGQDGSSSRGFAKITGGKANSTSGDYGGQIAFRTRVNGDATIDENMRMNGNGIVINETSGNKDFRVESDSYPNAILLDGSSGEVNFDNARTNFGGTTTDTSDGEVNMGLIKLRNSNTTSGEFLSIDCEGTTAGQSMTHYWYDGAYRNRFQVGGNTNQTIVNESGLDVDFRVEGDGNPNMLYVDAGNDRIFFGATAFTTGLVGMDYNLDTSSDWYSDNKAVLMLKNSNANGNVSLKMNNATDLDSFIVHNTNGTSGFHIYDRTATAKRMTVTSGETVFNEDSKNVDFRVESDARTHAIFLDASHGAGGAVKFVSASATVTSVEKGAYFAENSGNFVHMVLVNESTAGNHSLIFLNRESSDGTFIEFRQANITEGTITVSGSTVSYNGFAGRHESSGIANTVEKGTVLSTVDELDTYPNQQYDSAEDGMVDHPRAGQDRTDHAKVKVSDTEGDTRVYGVVDDYTDQGKVNVIGVGIGSIKVTGACSGGDLLESNGDGTARVQSDDIIRSKTIGKVTVGNSNTGVKLVSCVLYCG